MEKPKPVHIRDEEKKLPYIGEYYQPDDRVYLKEPMDKYIEYLYKMAFDRGFKHGSKKAGVKRAAHHYVRSKEINGDLMAKIDFFMAKLEHDLHKRYEACNPAAADSSSILLAVLNAVAEARKKTIEVYGKSTQQAVSPDAQGDAVYCGGCGYNHIGKCPDDSEKRR